MLSIDTPIGELTIKADDIGVTAIYFAGDTPPGIHRDSHPILNAAAEQIAEYFAGTRKSFDLPLHLADGFFKTVWVAMISNVGFGQTATYGQIANMVGSPRGARAIGMANNRNPIPIIIPCHRIMGANGALTGFRWGLDVKKKLLAHEGVQLISSH